MLRPDHQSGLPPARRSFVPIRDSVTKSVAHPHPPARTAFPNPEYRTATIGSIEVDFHNLRRCTIPPTPPVATDTPAETQSPPRDKDKSIMRITLDLTNECHCLWSSQRYCWQTRGLRRICEKVSRVQISKPPVDGIGQDDCQPANGLLF
jgi:hypothetical protein